VRNEALSRAVFAELKITAPARVSYTLFRDGLDFVHLFVNTASDDASVLTELDSFKTYSADIAGRCEAPPEVTRFALTLLDSYGLD
jgi:hypothetical protein